jgi:hypothetical protein
VVRGLLIAGLATAASAAMASAALAQPTLTVREHCPVEGGQQVYGAEATASGLPPNTVFDFEVSFGGRSGDSYAVSSDADGDLAPLRAAYGSRVKFIAVTLTPLSPEGTIAPLTAKVRKPCKAQAASRGARH